MGTAGQARSRHFFSIYSTEIMKLLSVFIATSIAQVVEISTGAEKVAPCGGRRHIQSCICDDRQQTVVLNPWKCRARQRGVAAPKSRPKRCDCKDGSSWTPPPGPCADLSHNIKSCICSNEGKLTNVSVPRECRGIGRVESCVCRDGTILSRESKARNNMGNGMNRPGWRLPGKGKQWN